MGDWGGAPAGWVPPEQRREQEAANEAAAAMEAARAAEDYRTESIASAIRQGFGVLADAIMVAAGVSSHERDALFVSADPAPAPNPGPLVVPPNPLLPEVDPDIEDLLDP